MFENFSKINYYLNGQTLELTDIFKSIKIDTTNTSAVSTTTNTNQSRPDQLAKKLYDDPKLFWINFAINGIKNPFREWNQSSTSLVEQNSEDYDTKVFQFGNTSKYLPTVETYFNPEQIDSYSGISLANIQQDDVIIFETGSGVFELKTYGAGQIEALNSCGYPHFGQTDIPDNFLNRNNIIQISCGKNFTACLDDTGYIWAWGQDIGLESSGFIVNGRLYNSPRGGYKHIDTTHNKIIAVTYNGGLECFGTCGDFTYTSETSVAKSAWMGGLTLAGVVIKTDNTVTPLGPIVSTNPTLQYCSDVSCADDYCLGVVTGPVSNGTVIGFGSTGYFSQIGQNTFYSKELTKLGSVSTTNPVYPFTDNNNKIIKDYENGVLEVSIKDLQPFTSPSGNSDEGYRAYYNQVYASQDENKILIGITDFDTYSKEGYIINNPKTFAGAGYEPYASNTYDYTQSYDKNLKPNRNYNLFKDSIRKFPGITSLTGINFYPTAVPVLTGPFRWTVLPSFKFNYLNDSSSYFSSSINYRNLFGISFVNQIGTDMFTDNLGLNTNYSNSGITAITNIIDGVGHYIEITNDKKIKIYTKYSVIDGTESDYSPSRRYVNVASYRDQPSGLTVDFHSDYFETSFGSIDYWGENTSRGLWVLKDNGVPYLIRPAEDHIKILAELEPETWGYAYNFKQDCLPPPGTTFKKIDFASCSAFWAAGLKNNGEIMIWGVTSDLNWLMGITNPPYTIPGITAKDITINGDNIVGIRNNGTIFTFGGTTFDALHTFNNFYGGVTVTNAVKVVGPSLKQYLDPMTVLTSDNKLIHMFPDANYFGLETNLWKAFLGITLGGFELKYNKPISEHLDDVFRVEKLNISYILNADTQIKDISGNSHNLIITKLDDTKIFTQHDPSGVFGTIQSWYASGIKLHTALYGLDVSKYKRTKGEYWLDNYFLNKDTGHKVLINVFDINSINNKTGYSSVQNRNEYPVLGLGVYNDIFTANTELNANSNNGIRRISLEAEWNPNFWATNVDYFSQIDNVINGGYTLSDYITTQYGVLWLYETYSKQKKPLIIHTPNLNYGYLSESTLQTNKIILGNGFIINLHPNNKLTFISGDKQPYNIVKDFSNLSTLYTVDFNNEDDFKFWENSIVEKIAIGTNRFYTYKPRYVENSVNYWGSKGENIEPKGLTYTQIDCFSTHCCGIRLDGKIECWGSDDSGIWVEMPDGTVLSGGLAVPPSLGVCNKVSVGYDHSCAEDVSGNIVCWGNNNYGQVTVPSYINDGTPNQILDCSKYFSAVQKTDGRILIWGRAITGPAEIIDLGNSVPTELTLES